MVFMETFHILEAFGGWAPFDSWDEHLEKILERVGIPHIPPGENTFT